MRGILLWLIGIPIPIIILLYLFTPSRGRRIEFIRATCLDSCCNRLHAIAVFFLIHQQPGRQSGEASSIPQPDQPSPGA